ncbi:GNAT family N-acetyltransferase [Thalassospira sp. TSL5-1]|uniref:GNAT family N-acetyltransferase n=1 Tax=Thalassospira sp. TSL5-1 TaxID=1544451 RepID=UPI001160F7A8|nr:GNAT family N-acetyltransferase [Thalassospira sp. TSL5-1]
MKNNPNIIIKAATPEDCDKVVALSNALHIELDGDEPAHSTNSIHAMMFGPNAMIKSLIAWAGNRAAGQVVFQPFYNPDYSKPGLWMSELYVTPDMRGQKVGEKLVSALAHYAGQNDYVSIWWSVLLRNEGACRFYERLGARNSGALQYEIDGTALATLGG